MKAFALFTTLCVAGIAANVVPTDSLSVASDEGISPKLRGGTPAKKYEFPYMVRILIYTGNETALCGGTIIRNNYVLTSAHCFTPPLFDNATIQVGYTNIVNLTGGEYSFDVNNSAVTLHPDYNEKSGENDIALVKTPMPFKKTKSSSKIPIAKKRATYLTGDAIFSGFGITKEDAQQASDVLLKATMPIIAGPTCGLWGPTYKPATMLCAGSLTGSPIGCKGDSGGPLVLNGTLIGVDAFNNGCDNGAGYPTVYMRVSAYRTWIDKNAV